MNSTERTVEPIDTPWVPVDTAVDYLGVERRHPAFRAFGARLGGTPLIEAPGPAGGAAVLAKCEWHNPEGSIKDRVAYALVGAALQAHGQRPVEELRVLEYSGGNLSRALSGLCRDLGIAARFVLSSASPRSLLDTLEERGARFDLVEADLGFIEVIRTALAVAEKEPDWTLLYQHRNSANPAFHARTTGAEILDALPAVSGGRTPEAWVASIGTGGTLIGVLRALRGRFPGVRAVGVCPSELPYGSEEPPNGLPKYGGSGGFGHGLKQPFVAAYDAEIEHRNVSYPQCLDLMAEYRDLTGVRIGSSAAANWAVAREIAASLPPSSTVLTVFPDAGTPEEWERIG
ncbi:pyridoxal-phosphate dependent enzyme [Streptomyces sp. NPDC047002]|uniref:pyridoxal-phosphate dependent enzyme n=1 Tax=Streptomyces sp. NPDC047002 TaxID=3155475 RepID=UPI003456D231